LAFGQLWHVFNMRSVRAVLFLDGDAERVALGSPEGGSGTSVGISGLMKPRGAGFDGSM